MADAIRFLCLQFFFMAALNAAPLDPKAVPEPLLPWVDWVLPQDAGYSCHFQFDDSSQRVCVWPSRLEVNLTDQGGRFKGSWRVTQKAQIALPGSVHHFPAKVSINGKPAVVTNRGGHPGITVENGEHTVEGHFVWKQLPPTFFIPPGTGILQLTVNGEEVDGQPDQTGSVWLRNGGAESAVANKLETKVFRKVSDEVPMRLHTLIRLNVSGENREVELGPLLPEDFSVVSVSSPLPHKLSSDNKLVLQLKPGVWEVSLDARSSNAIAEIIRPESDNASWPEDEIWVLQADTGYRLVEIAGVSSIDPQQSQLPDAWKNLPAYLFKVDDQMQFKVVRRGDNQTENNQLSLHRKLWLDFDGNGYTMQDWIQGAVQQGWRINSSTDMVLGRVAINGQPQLVTLFNGRQGVELRQNNLSMEADSRYNGDIRQFSAVGWDHDFSSLSAELQLPPGWRLIAAAGVDDAPGSWWQQWTLLDLFLVLIIAIAVGRLWPWYWGVLALVGLGLSWKEPDAPKLIWLNLVAILALMRVLENSAQVYRWLGWYRKISLVVLLLIAIPFAVQQVRTGLFPQLENHGQGMVPVAPVLSTGPDQQGEGAPLPEMAQEIMADSAVGRSVKRMAITKQALNAGNEYGASQAGRYAAVDPEAKIQTGPGLPQWHWQQQLLRWNGPVEKSQMISLWLLSPQVNLLVNLFRLIFIGLFLVAVFSPDSFGWLRLKVSGKGSINLVLLFFFTGMFAWPGMGQADIPDENMLEQLRARLTAPADCLPTCAAIAEMNLAVSDEKLTLTLAVHAEEHVAVPLPGTGLQGSLLRVLVDGDPAERLRTDSSGRLLLGVDRGVHRVEMIASLFNRRQLDLYLPIIPHHVSVAESGSWHIEGVDEDGHATSPIRLTLSKQNVRDFQVQQTEVELPPYLQVVRQFNLGLDWRVTTEVRRISSANQTVITTVPLLENESVVSSDIPVENGVVRVNLAAGQYSMQWESTLHITPEIHLQAADNKDWNEVWKVATSPVWHPEISGIPMIYQRQDGDWVPEWSPWPGEQVNLKMTRLKGADGATLTIDQSRVEVTPGSRSTAVMVDLSIRSSQGGQHHLILPEDAELLSVSVNGQQQPIRQEGEHVILPLKPGIQDFRLNFIWPYGISGSFQTPPIDLGVASVNNSIRLVPGASRWLLWASGPAMGPAILFWGILGVALLIAMALGQIRLTPLKTRHWMLLMVGLTQLPVAAAMLVVGWFILLGWHNQQAPAASTTRFNLKQVFLFLASIAALATLFSAVQKGLLGSPNIQVAGNLSTPHQLNWYADHSQGILPRAQIWSVPMVVYRVLMLAWSLWLANALLSWLKWGWGCFSRHGIWRKPELRKSMKQLLQNRSKQQSD